MKEKLYDVIDEDGEIYLSAVTYNVAEMETDGYNDPEGKMSIAEHSPLTIEKGIGDDSKN
ncbi:hypothetical protein PN797_001162 [Enterobacter hormaechei]|nr:hypothetical protein [Enterobacter hormaechei]